MGTLHGFKNKHNHFKINEFRLFDGSEGIQ